jgi:misacylated tRNA(Ala) deacylase
VTVNLGGTAGSNFSSRSRPNVVGGSFLLAYFLKMETAMMDSENGQPMVAPMVAPTVLLYQRDSYVREFDASVVAVEGSAVALDQTAFFPGGGGQMADRGTLTIAGGTYPITAMRKSDDVIWHVLDLGGREAPPVGAVVLGALDWDFRYQMMRTHTALHSLTAVIFRDYGAQVTGGQMYPDRARMDFALEGFKAEMAPEIERRVNEELAKDYPVRVRFLPRDEAFAIPDLIRTKVNLLPPEIETIRIVEIIGLDLQADGGTHVAHTGEVGAIHILKTENKGKINKRMEIALAEKE